MDTPTRSDENDSMEIEQLGPDEIDRLRSLRFRSLQDAPDAFGSTVEELLARSSESWTQQLVAMPTFVAVEHGEDLGIARGAIDGDDPSSAWLLSVWVDPRARGRQASDRLVARVIDWARARGTKRVLLDVGDHNASAIALYVRLGFEPTGETSQFPPPRDHVREHRRCLRL